VKQWRIDSLTVQKMVQDFTMSGRFWTAFPIDRIEYILKFYHALPSGYTYRNFDEIREELVWAPNGLAIADEIERQTQKHLIRDLEDEEVTKLQKFLSEKMDP
jgi:hypothetical protein